MSEHTDQVALIQWCLTEARHTPELGLIYAVPNAGKRENAQGAWMLAEGLRKGMLDLCLPVARHGFHSYYIELKVDRNKPSPEQEWWIARLEAQGHKVDVFWDWQLAAQALELYAEVPHHRRGQWLMNAGAGKAISRQVTWHKDFATRVERLLQQETPNA